MLYYPEKCFCDEPCQPLAQIVSDDLDQNGKPQSYFTICERLTKPKNDREAQDKYIVRFKNDLIDDLQYYDYRDLVDTMSVIAQTLSIVGQEH